MPAIATAMRYAATGAIRSAIGAGTMPTERATAITRKPIRKPGTSRTICTKRLPGPAADPADVRRFAQAPSATQIGMIINERTSLTTTACRIASGP